MLAQCGLAAPLPSPSFSPSPAGASPSPATSPDPPSPSPSPAASSPALPASPAPFPPIPLPDGPRPTDLLSNTYCTTGYLGALGLNCSGTEVTQTCCQAMAKLGSGCLEYHTDLYHNEPPDSTL